MEVDTEYLQRYYSSLSDEGFSEIDRADLVEAAQKCYDKELGRRQLDLPDEKSIFSSSHEEKPEWINEAAEVYSANSIVGTDAGKDADKVRSVLQAAGIPCYVDVCEDPPDEVASGAVHRWRVSVPGRLSMRATSILDRDIFNDEFEAIWRTHLEMLTDQELSDAEPKEIFCGLFDRIERVVTSYNDELSRRGLAPKRS
jgi:hypothetical protein